MDDIAGKIIENVAVCEGYYRCRVKLSKSMGKVDAGQFVMVKVPSSDVFLRRPFSIFDYGNKVVTILYKVVGKGTDALARASTDDRVMVLGPLGNGFRLASKSRPILVAGGIGVAGIYLLWRRLKGRADVFFGCSTSKEVALLADINPSHPHVSTLDGSRGFKGTVVDLLANHLSHSEEDFAVYACGPEGMFASLKKRFHESKLPCQVLVEERMACGLGLCFGCVKKTTDDHEPYKRACMEGPVFDLWQLSL
jgi:dihydroorotate dehydrogenase electron transfer subunit